MNEQTEKNENNLTAKDVAGLIVVSTATAVASITIGVATGLLTQRVYEFLQDRKAKKADKKEI